MTDVTPVEPAAQAVDAGELVVHCHATRPGCEAVLAEIALPLGYFDRSDLMEWRKRLGLALSIEMGALAYEILAALENRESGQRGVCHLCNQWLDDHDTDKCLNIFLAALPVAGVVESDVS